MNTLARTGLRKGLADRTLSGSPAVSVGNTSYRTRAGCTFSIVTYEPCLWGRSPKGVAPNFEPSGHRKEQTNVGFCPHNGRDRVRFDLSEARTWSSKVLEKEISRR